jgi:phospholipid/cholesterol/gamma-HCH transport system substrate-binding protein
MRGQLPLHQRALIGAIGTSLVAASTAIAVQAAFGAFDGGYEIVGVFDRAGQGLDTDADVKLRGVTVGDVEAIELGDDGRAVVRLRIDDGVRVADTTTAAIAPISVFGPTYVQLDPGEHEGTGPYLADGDTLATTRAPIEFTEVLADAERLLSAVDPLELATVVSELADGLRGTGPALAGNIDDGAVLVDVAARHDADTQRFLRDLADLGATLGPRGDELVRTMGGLAEGLSPVAEHPDQLGALLDDARTVAVELADLLAQHAPAVGAGITAGALATDVILAHLGDLPGYLDSLATYFSVLGNSIRVPGPRGAILATQKFFLPEDLCAFIIGLCPAGTSIPVPLPGQLPPPDSPPIELPPLPLPPVVTVPSIPPVTLPLPSGPG